MKYVFTEIRHRLKEEPSFVALEGYDAILVLAEITNQFGTSHEDIADSWAKVSVEGTRGEITLSKSTESMFAQWQEAPVQVVERDEENLNKYKVLYFGNQAKS
ncbi:hypothetical protein [Croceivirga sp. JEA036]|uniref:hypothetical protein n=1 Tax=Croceivirga sp. JEA036 TaxID=2721162 RepID=UPI0014387BE8|nr:hypothetical protein [Croceivirga sp. JEA036]NJB37787.1 hypothetical protein [Croceivirga sp. JEA036]